MAQIKNKVIEEIETLTAKGWHLNTEIEEDASRVCWALQYVGFSTTACISFSSPFQ